MKRVAVLALALLFGGILPPGEAEALVILTLDNDGTPNYQQQQSNPCVVGNPSCQNPLGFTYTDINAADNNGVVTETEGTSPLYTVGQIRGLAGNLFSVGIDTNQAGGAPGSELRILLQSFRLFVGGVEEFSFTVPTSINLTQGGGFSDALLLGFDLTGFAPGASAQFKVSYSNATNGPESFFLVGTPLLAPEPGSLALLGVALAGLALARRRRAR